jgi:predicted kinase
MCGLPGSGKSTLARRLSETEAALRLSPDEWMLAIGAEGYDEAMRARVEALQWDLAQRLLARGVSVILENGFWRRDERQGYRLRAAELGAATKVHFLDAPLEVLKARIAARNAQLPAGSFVVRPEDIEEWMATAFEPPGADELD